MDPEKALDAATEGAKAVTKFQEIIQKVFSPRWTRKQADADAYADDRKLQTIRENPDMDIVYIEGKINARQKTPEALDYRAKQRMLADSIRQEENLEKVFELAAEEMYISEYISEEAVDEDWIYRIINIVKEISNEEMQFLWAKILAGEVKQPGSFSLRTLNTIRNISQKEAQVFQKILPLLITGDDSWFISSNSSIHNKYGITYDDILLLDECGLIVSNGTVSITITISKDSIIAHNTKCALLSEGLRGEKDFTFGIYSLTNVGVELIKILEYEPNNAYFFEFAEYVFKQNYHSKLKIQPIESINGNKIHTTGNSLREFKIS